MKTLNKIALLCTGIALSITSCQKADDLPMEEAPQAIETSDDVELRNASNINKLIADVRKATKQFHNVDAAMAAGYENTMDCVEGPPGVGAMGVHFVKGPLLDDVHNPLEPEVLVYEIKNDGTYKLVAVEYLHVGADSPMFGGEVHFHPFPQPFADYALHIWAWKGNPNGIFEDFNVNVSCP